MNRCIYSVICCDSFFNCDPRVLQINSNAHMYVQSASQIMHDYCAVISETFVKFCNNIYSSRALQVLTSPQISWVGPADSPSPLLAISMFKVVIFTAERVISLLPDGPQTTQGR